MMFELLEDGREARRKALLRPRYLLLALLGVFVIGANVGVLLGKHDSNFLDWFVVGANALCITVFWPLFREFYKFLKDHEGR
jgi:hypothetical protein